METYDPHKSTSDVRQGSPRMMNLRVLTISLLLIIAAFAIIFLLYSVMSPAQA